MLEDEILLLLESHHKLGKIAKALGLDKQETKKILKELINKNKVILIDNLYFLVKQGKLEVINNKNYGFILPIDETTEEDYFVSIDNFNGAFPDDIVNFYLYKDRSNNKIRADIINVVEHTRVDIIGEVILNKKKNYEVKLIDKDDTYILTDYPNILPGAIIRAKLIYNKKVTAKYIDIIGYKDDPGIEIATIAAVYGFNSNYPDEVKEEVKNIPQVVLESDLTNRTDFTNLNIITIDGDDSKDFDDAIYVEKNNDNTYTLGVYIADVSHYVKFNSPLDKEAYKRGTSVYLADRVIPMLPRDLSNGICSLNEGEKRLVLAIIMRIDNKGRCLDSSIKEGVILSRHRMTYNNVNKILQGDKALIDKYKDIYQMLLWANELHHIIRKKREDAGSIDFNIDEYKFILNNDGSPKDIIKRERLDAEKLIEDFMIMANEEVAKYASHLELPFLYRIHDKPNEEKLEDFISYAGNMIDIKKNKNIYPKQIQSILKTIDDKPEASILNQMLLRTMAKAKYSDNNIGHYGLALKNYCHFTSPIRRYPDLIVHRIIKELIIHPKNYDKAYNYYSNNLAEIGLKTSIMERNSIECEREVDDMLYAWYMEQNIGKTYTGIVSSMTNFGLFVKLDKGIEGLIHTKYLDTYYEFNEKDMSFIIGTKVYHLGDKIDIVVTNADKKSKKIDFALKENEVSK